MVLVVSLFFLIAFLFRPWFSQVTSTSGRMAPKRPTAMMSSIFVEDDISLMEMPAFPKAMPKRPAPQDDGSKRRKQASSHPEKTKGTSQEGREKDI